MNEARRRLLDFLNSFETAYHEVAGDDAVNFSLDKFYGDCTEVLLSLLSTIETYAGMGQRSGPKGGHRATEGQTEGSGSALRALTRCPALYARVMCSGSCARGSLAYVRGRGRLPAR